MKLSITIPTPEQERELLEAIRNNGYKGILQREKPKRSFDWMILWMCVGFGVSFILGYIACLIRSL